jgi:multicomponent Na+:H+ antiporter subunit A
VRVTQPGDVRLHATVVFATLVALVGGTLVTRSDVPWALRAPVGTPYEYLITIVVALAAFATVRARSRLEAVTALGVVGFGIALVFTFFSAPDLAITQFLVETLVVILVALVLMRLPKSRLRTEARPGVRAVALPIAVAAGTLVTALLAMVTSLPLNEALTAFFAENAYQAAKGKNVVNVILVDFRALDTLGEITVLAVAATGAYALLRRVTRRSSDEVESSGPRGIEESTS